MLDCSGFVFKVADSEPGTRDDTVCGAGMPFKFGVPGLY